MSEPRTGLEIRLAEALEHGAAGAPPAVGLAGAARGRAARRRRTRLALAAAVVVLAIAVPPAVLASGGDGSRDDGPGPAGGTGSTSDTATDTASDPVHGGDDPANGFHWESWHDVTLQVPNTWAYGSLGDWCVGGGTTDTPRVQRPDTPTDMILCSPQSTYGVSIAPMPAGADAVDWPVVAQSGDSWPAGAEVGARSIGGWVITVATRKSTVAQAVLDSARLVDDVDPNGCAPELGGPGPHPGEGVVAVCRYDAGHDLVQSEELEGDGASEAMAALAAAPEDSRRGPPCAQPVTPPTTEITMTTDVTTWTVGFGGSCWSDDRVTSSADDVSRRLGAEVLYWALSPGFSGDVTGLPLPPELRQE